MSKRKYPNRADKTISLWLALVAAVSIQISIVVGFVLLNETKVEMWIAFLVAIIIFIILTVGFGSLVFYLTSPKKNTPRGENTYNYMMDVYSHNDNYRFVKTKEEIENILITPYGVYAISKITLEGRIYGMDSEEYWRQSFAFKKKKNRLDNVSKDYLDKLAKFKKKYDLSIDIIPVLVLLSNNRGYLNSEVLYAPGELKSLVNPNDPKILSEKEMDALQNKLSK